MGWEKHRANTRENLSILTVLRSARTTINWLVYGEAPRGIVNSQIIDLANRIEKDTNLHSIIWVLSPLRSYFDFSTEYSSLESDTTIKVLPMLPFQGRNTLWQLNSLILFLARTFQGRGKQIWIARGPKAGAMIRLLKRADKSITFIYQSRGSVYDEAYEYPDDSAGQMAIKQEKENLINCDKIFSVTDQLIERHEEIYSLTLKNKSLVCPTIILARRVMIPDNLLKENDSPKNPSLHRFIYMSGGQEWQSDELVINFLREVKSITKRDFELRYLGNPPKQIIKEQLLSLCKVEFGRVDSNSVIREMQNAHFGLLLRDNTMTNHVSSPTKFAEYCAAGLIPVIKGVPFFQNLLDITHTPHISIDSEMDVIFPANIDFSKFNENKKRVLEFAHSHLSENSMYYTNMCQYLIRLRQDEL